MWEQKCVMGAVNIHRQVSVECGQVSAGFCRKCGLCEKTLWRRLLGSPFKKLSPVSQQEPLEGFFFLRAYMCALWRVRGTGVNSEEKPGYKFSIPGPSTCEDQRGCLGKWAK